MSQKLLQILLPGKWGKLIIIQRNGKRTKKCQFRWKDDSFVLAQDVQGDGYFLRRVAGSSTKSEDPGEQSDFRLGFINFFGDLAFDIMKVSLFTLDKNKH